MIIGFVTKITSDKTAASANAEDPVYTPRARIESAEGVRLNNNNNNNNNNNKGGGRRGCVGGEGDRMQHKIPQNRLLQEYE
jgi:hypothetical protein